MDTAASETPPGSTPTKASQGQYQMLTQTDAGTPAGELLRRYWQPVGLSAELPPGSAPQPVKIMGQDLVLFRDQEGRAGVLVRKCAHRCADLSYGRIEAGGLRCVYHGWVFDVGGRCLEQPAEPPESTFKNRVHQTSYPTHEEAGAIWVYLGPGEAPLFPKFPVFASDEYRYTTRWRGRSNWLQASEGNIDPVHTSFLHQIELKDPIDKARWGIFSINARPYVSATETRFGVRIFTKRNLPNSDDVLTRVPNFVMPNAACVGFVESYLGIGGCSMLFDVPIDDTDHWRYEFIFHRSGKFDEERLVKQYEAEQVGDRETKTQRRESLLSRPERNGGR